MKLPFFFKWTRDQQSIHFRVISHIVKAKKSGDKRTCISSAACAMWPVVMWKPAWLWHLWRSPDWNVKAVFTIKESSNLGTAHYLWGWPGQIKSDQVMRNFVPEKKKKTPLLITILTLRYFKVLILLNILVPQLPIPNKPFNKLL